MALGSRNTMLDRARESTSNSAQLPFESDGYPIGFSCHQVCVTGHSLPQSIVPWTNSRPAAVERVPEIKPEDVQEVFFGNVLSAKLVLSLVLPSIEIVF